MILTGIIDFINKDDYWYIQSFIEDYSDLIMNYFLNKNWYPKIYWKVFRLHHLNVQNYVKMGQFTSRNQIIVYQEEYKTQKNSCLFTTAK